MSVADAPKRARRDRRSWPQRILIAVNLVIVMGGLAGAGSLAYLYERVDSIETLDIPELGPQTGEPPPVPGDPENFLLVGSDSRDFVATTGEDESFGSPESYPDPRADTILLVRLDPRAKTATMVSFPRDLVVEVEGAGQGRINTAFERGPNQLIATIEANFDVPIHHYVQTDFAAFRDLVDAIGGVELFFQYPVRDWGRPEPGARLTNITGLNIPGTGCLRLDGAQALAYVRSRHFEQLIDGEWEPDPAADLGRIRRQQDFLRRVARTALDEDLLSPRRVLDLLDVAEGHLRWDRGLDINDIVDLARQFEGVLDADIQQVTLPVENHPTRRGQLRIADEAEADRLMSVFRGEEAAAPPDPGDTTPAEVTITVVNGSGIGGQATAAGNGLRAAGFTVASVGDRADRVARTTVEHPPGEEQAAALVASYLGGAEILEVDDAAVVTVVTGPDFTEVSAEPVAGTTTTTVPGPTTTTTISRQEELERFYAGVAAAECGADRPS